MEKKISRKVIFYRMMLIFLIMEVVVLTLAVTSVTALISSIAGTRRLYEMDLIGVYDIGEVNREVNECVALVNKYALEAVLKTDKAFMKGIEDQLWYTYNHIEVLFGDFKKKMHSTDNELASKTDEAMLRYREGKDLLAKVMRAADVVWDNPSSVAGQKELKEALANLDSKGTALLDVMEEMGVIKINNVRDRYVSGRTASIIIMAGLSLFGLASSLTIIILGGILSRNIERVLKEMVSGLNMSTAGIVASTAQLAEVSEHLADGASKQAASIEETSAALSQSAAMIAQNTENTRQANRLAAASKAVAGDGMRKMRDMVAAMDQIKESSDTIGRIVRVIDDIAFQTNLLAINATIEAARAGGAAGRSFAVVADEVRNLAQSSAKAAADTTQIIENNIKLTSTGKTISHDVAAALEQITSEIGKLSEIISEINAAGEEQSTGIRQINAAVSQMERVTQENAAVAEENAAAAHSIETETGSLRQVVVLAKEMIRANKLTETAVAPAYYGSSGARGGLRHQPAPKNSPASGGTAKAADKPAAERIIPLDSDNEF